MLTDQHPENVPDSAPTPATSGEPIKTASSPWRDDLIGQQIGAFRLQERLGGGAMASVYRAIDERSNQMAAIKLVLPGADAFVRERFQREVRTTRLLNHPNIVRTLEVSPAPESNSSNADAPSSNDSSLSPATYSSPAYIAMELVEGESLSEALERVGQLSLVDSCALLAPVARALYYAHTQGIVHRDVKPSNILLKRTLPGQPGAVRLAAFDYPVIPLLSDFGIARAFDAPELTNAGRTIGTPAYMAPEQCEGSRNIDGRADIYALGAVLYRCLIGRPLFTGGTTQILHAHVYEPVTIPDEHYRLISPLVLEIIQLTLAKAPADRYPDAEMLADDLSAAAGLMVRPVATRRNSNQQDITATMTMSSLPVTNESNAVHTVHVLVAGHATRTATSNTTTVPRAPQLETPIPLIPSRAVTPSARRARRARQGFAGSWFALLMLVLVLGLSVLAINWVLPRPTTGGDSTVVATAAQVAQVDLTAQPATLVQSPTALQAISSVDNSASPSPSPSLAVTLPAPTSDETSLPLLATVSETTTTQSSIIPANASIITMTAPPSKSELPSIDGTQPTSATQALLVGTESVTPFPSVTPITATPEITTTATPIPLADLDEALARGREAYLAKDWNSAYEELSIVRTSAPDYASAEVIQLLRNSMLALAAANNETGNYFPTAELIDNTLPLLGEQSVTIINLREAARSMLRAESSLAITEALTNLQSVHLQLASELAAADAPCEAFVQAETALTLLPIDTEAQTGLDGLLEEYRTTCDEFNRQQRTTQFWAALSGRLLFSAQAEEGINIYSMPVTNTARPTLLLVDARYPAAPQQGAPLAYYNTRSDAGGLYLFDVNIVAQPTERGKRLTYEFTEDGEKSVSSWNWDGSRLVFASEREGDRRSRLYIIDRAGDGNREALIKGIEPAWRPVPPGTAGGDWIVYNGRDETGNNPGLWQINSSGGPAYQLTNAADDRHPTWSPDGRSLYFMNASRRNHWSIFWAPISEQPVGLLEFNIAPIADSPSDEVLPAVSPDGQALAFLSNRGGRWQVWLLSLDPALADSEPLWLADLNIGGQDAASWAAHSLIWVN